MSKNNVSGVTWRASAIKRRFETFPSITIYTLRFFVSIQVPIKRIGPFVKKSGSSVL